VPWVAGGSPWRCGVGGRAGSVFFLPDRGRRGVQDQGVKLLLVADLHYTLRQWDWVGQAAERFDLVVIAGDLLEIGSIVPLEAQVVVVRKYLDKLSGRAPVLVSSGNHDILPDGDTRRAAWLRQSRGERLHPDGAGVAVCGHFFSVLPWWEDEGDRITIERQLEVQCEQAGELPWVWIYHPPPEGTTVAWNGRRDFGDARLVEWIRRYRPAMVLGGHIHAAPFQSGGSWIDQLDGSFLFNSGRQPGGMPTFTVIDTDEGRAVWMSAAEAEQARLELPLRREPLEGPAATA